MYYPSASSKERNLSAVDYEHQRSNLSHLPQDSQQSVLNHANHNQFSGTALSFSEPDIQAPLENGSHSRTPSNTEDGNGFPAEEDSELSVCPQRSSRVRFRSRVRITSGINRHKHKSPSHFHHVDSDYFAFSRASSMSGSPSSSISAPLRSRMDDEIAKPGWGTLGQRVGLFARNSQQRKVNGRANSFRKYPAHLESDANDQTPLMRSTTLRTYEREEETRLSREIDMVFGPWPSRLLNHHWWWWHLEPIICCRCVDDSDFED
ncbi:hypothetical protein BDQ12DRAFT_415408 [Crucibulum laeve]|uniref:Uncharacterized protein n=1 Tax=Crucibulum laeve TaxID=68775 RepID=A0A5C3M6H2_9AGAR|nr:hypothetical protein BDQ12DRAFT_415408 [Crucibulum laeve]